MKAEEIILIAELEDENERLDSFCSEKAKMTRNSISILIKEKQIKVNGLVMPKSYKVKMGDSVIITIPPPVDAEIKAENISLEIVFEDDDLLVVNKPKGMVVHPSAGHFQGTLVNALMYHCKDSLSGINGEIRPGIVHRIDKDTSGLLIVAKNDFSHIRLAEQIKAHSFLRVYEAVVNGCIKQDGMVNAPIARHKQHRKKMCVSFEANARNALTHYEVVQNYNNYTHLRLKLETGRTHQIRVHMAYIGHGVVGDSVYSNGKPKWLNGQCLHAREIGFVHPRSGKYFEFKSDLPEYFIKLLNSIR